MAAGDRADMLDRLKSVLPPWFPSETPLLDGVLMAPAAVMAWAYGFLALTKLQTRIATATDRFLDLAAFDFFGLRVRRKPGQNDKSFRAVIPAEVLRARGTRDGILQAITDLTGGGATMFEPYYPFDTGGWDSYALGFDQAGGWGSRDMPYEVLIHADQPVGAGVPNAAGLDSSFAAWDGGYSTLMDVSDITGTVTFQDIYDVIESTRAAGITCWVNISPRSPPPP